MGYDPSKKAWVMGYQRVMGYPPCPNSGRAKKYGVSEVMGYQKVWVMGSSTVGPPPPALSKYVVLRKVQFSQPTR